MNKISVIIKFNLEGLHNWPEAKEIYPDVSFLSDLHRHIFHFKLSKIVNHDDRDVEFIRWKREVIQWLWEKYGVENLYLNFNRMSCEQIATELLYNFDCNFVEVWEDNENGSRIEKIN